MSDNPFEAIYQREQAKRDVQKAQEPAPPPPGTARLLPLARQFDWGTQIVASSHSKLIPIPIAASGPQPEGVVVSIVSGQAAFSADTYVRGSFDFANRSAISGASYAPPATVRFHPPQSGKHSGELEIFARWSDGHVEKHRLGLSGAAATLEGEGQQQESKPAPSADSVNPPAAIDDAKPIPDSVRTAMGLQVASAHSFAGALGRAHGAGVAAIEAEGKNYQARPQSRSIWMELAEVAVNFGIGAVAGVVGQFVVKRMAQVIADDLRVPNISLDGSTPSTLPASMPIGDRGAVKQISKILETSLKKLGEATIAQGVREQAAEKSTSSEPVTNFFGSQQKGVSHYIVETEQLVALQDSMLTPLLQTNPALALSAMTALGQSLKAGEQVATEKQALSTGQAWSAFKARDTLGTESIGQDGPEVTRLAGAREFTDHGLVPPSAIPGLLDVHVTVKGDKVAVTSASMLGISKHTLLRFLELDLATAQMPVRLVVNNGAAFITRDESGRIRVVGAYHLFDHEGLSVAESITEGEAQAHQGAARVVTIALSRTLQGWGISQIQHDDASK